jgi:hypothetical protein
MRDLLPARSALDQMRELGMTIPTRVYPRPVSPQGSDKLVPAFDGGAFFVTSLCEHLWRPSGKLTGHW